MATPGRSRPAQDGQHASDEVVEWYSEHADEQARLTSSPQARLETARTRAVLSRHLRDEPLDVLDVGGGTGPYALWLSQLGHRVTVVEPVPRHVAAASALPGVHAVHGDARALPVPDRAYDLVLMLGPLYHLASAGDRAKAWQEAVRVARPGGLIAASAVGRYSFLVRHALQGGWGAAAELVLTHLLRTGENLAQQGFPLQHAHTSAELEAEAAAAGLRVNEIVGLEGPAADALATDADPAAVQGVARIADLLEHDRQVMDLSPHLLIVTTSGPHGS